MENVRADQPSYFIRLLAILGPIQSWLNQCGCHYLGLFSRGGVGDLASKRLPRYIVQVFLLWRMGDIVVGGMCFSFS